MTNQPTPRPLHELLWVLLENIDRIGTKFTLNKEITISGLCGLNNELFDTSVISDKECLLIKMYIRSIVPMGFHLSPAFEIAPRKQWLEEQIQKLKKKKDESN